MGKAILSHLGTSKEQLAAHNLEVGSELSTFMSNLFYEEFDKGSHTLGGKYKLKMISSSSPGFELHRPEPQSLHPLQTLLNDLYSLLHEHYAALDLTSLSRYKMEQTVIRSATFNDPILEPELPDWLEPWLPQSTAVESTSIKKPVSVDNKQRLVTWNRPHDPQPSLDSHDNMMRIFTTLLQDKSGVWRFCFGDKTEDQLYGLTQKVDLPPTQASAFNSSKRKSDESQSQRGAKQPRVEGSSTGTLDVIGEEDRQAAS